MDLPIVNRLTRSLLLPISIAAASVVLAGPAAAESDEGFFTRLFNRGKAELSPTDSKQQTLDCPEIRVTAGESSLRIGGQESTSVRHQFSIGDVARECGVTGKELTVKVGVKGRVVLGPAGSPGSYSAPLRIAVRQQQGDKILASKVFTVGATIAPGTSRGEFTVVTEPFAVPFTTEHAADDYEIVVGFGKDAKAAPVEKRKRRQSKASAAGGQD